MRVARGYGGSDFICRTTELMRLTRCLNPLGKAELQLRSRVGEAEQHRFCSRLGTSARVAREYVAGRLDSSPSIDAQPSLSTAASTIA